METLKIYVVNLQSYNNGRTRGRWYELPVNFRQIQRDLLLDEEHGEEYAIHDFENFYGYRVGEYSSIKELNEYAEKLEEISDIDHLKDFLEIYDIDDVIDNKDDLDFVEARDDEDLAQELIERTGGLETLSVETLQRYFNFGAYGRELALTDYSQTSHGYIRNI
ncbi:antirestriction protein ArdA [Lactococcus protaetiae]|uniref:Antirestriction protein ArdA n=1 Tax=Lactococcus protaetiae TaxID=2592653 RepID=A0A514Z856_9LACT|nr:antirestriction protein ArdA [Lactococcus protaetiae]QDK70768.1 antirestriction protein ArdA [Lactococcus protaetiae]